jgi:hypothetical protein
MKKTILSIALATLVSVSSAYAVDPATSVTSTTPATSTQQTNAPAGNKMEMYKAQKEAKMQRNFEMMDTNKDGAISMEEHQAYTSAKFKKLDSNSDGKVTKEEMQAGHQKMKDMKQMHQQKG